MGISVSAGGGAGGAGYDRNGALDGDGGAASASILNSTAVSGGNNVSASVSASAGRGGGSSPYGGRATATINGNTLSAPGVSIDTVIAYQAGGSGSISITNNNVTLAAGGSTGLGGSSNYLTLTIKEFNYPFNANYTQNNLINSEGGNFFFSGNSFVGRGDSFFDLITDSNSAAPTSTPITIDTATGTLQIGGSDTNSLIGFTGFSVGADHTFIVGPGTYNLYNQSSGKVEYTPQSGNLIVNNESYFREALDFRGFDPSLDAATIQSDITTDGSNTYINVPGAGTIELYRYTAPVPAADLQFEPASPPCFLAGTAIATPNGEQAVETLSPGDLVLTADGSARPVRWLGRSTVSRRFHNPLRGLPIRIRAGALAEGTPTRDLLVSPDHAMFLFGFLIEAGALVNAVTITRETGMPEMFTYYHVELDAHRLVLAEGALTESFVDNVDRMAFDNWNEHPAEDSPEMEEMSYARAKSARQLPASVRRLVTERMTALGHVSVRAA